MRFLNKIYLSKNKLVMKDGKEYYINEISKVLLKGEILRNISVGMGVYENIEAGGSPFYIFRGEFSNGKANGVCQLFNEVNCLIEEGIYLDNKLILAINYEESFKNKVMVLDENLNIPRIKDLDVEENFTEIKDAVSFL